MQDGHSRGRQTGHALLTKRWLVRYIISVAAALSKTRNFLGLTVKTDFQLTPRQKRGHQRPRTFFTASVHFYSRPKKWKNSAKQIQTSKANPTVLTFVEFYLHRLNLLRNHYSKSFKNVDFSLLEAFFERLKTNCFGQKNYLSCPFYFVLKQKSFDFDTNNTYPASLIFTFFLIF